MVIKSRICSMFLLIILEYIPKNLADTCENEGKIDMKYLENIKADSEYLIFLRNKIHRGIELITDYPEQKSIPELEDVAYGNYLDIAVTNLKLFVASTMSRLRLESAILNMAIQHASATKDEEDSDRYINIVDKLNGVKNDYEQLKKGLKEILDSVSKICFAKDGALLNLQDASAYVEAEEKLKEIKTNIIKIYNNSAFKMLTIFAQSNRNTIQNLVKQAESV